METSHASQKEANERHVIMKKLILNHKQIVLILGILLTCGISNIGYADIISVTSSGDTSLNVIFEWSYTQDPSGYASTTVTFEYREKTPPGTWKSATERYAHSWGIYWIPIRTYTPKEIFRITGLKPETTYEVRANSGAIHEATTNPTRELEERELYLSIYWTDWGTDKIQRSNLDGSNVEDLVTTGLENPYGIALDVAGGKMYWTDYGTDNIQRANLDGSNVEDLFTQGLVSPRGIALEFSAIPQIVREDVNRDGVVNAYDLAYISLRYGRTDESDADINNDGVVNIDDLILVAAVIDSAPAAPAIRSRIPKDLTAAAVNQWLTEAKLTGNKTPIYQRGILTLELLLAALIPKETILLANYPNPFNPETWIPYQLANDSDVSLSIYDINGALVRELDLGHQQAGYYTERTKAAYWDGRNEWGEQVASGVYFYYLQAGDYSQMRKLVILK